MITLFFDMMQIEKLQADIQPLRSSLSNHPLYGKIQNLEDLKVFTEQHIFAVWDFMSLLKALQRELTCVEVPWTPKGNPVVRRFINEIVWGEESDLDENGKPASHFEMYHSAMKSIHANTSQIDNLTTLMQSGINIHEALTNLSIHPSTKKFVEFTFQVIQTRKAHLIAAVFTFGREDIIPDMFIALLKEMKSNGHENVASLLYYLERHIEVDGGEHGPIALKMIEELCGNDEHKWTEATQVAVKSLENRIELWNGILEVIEETKIGTA